MADHNAPFDTDNKLVVCSTQQETHRQAAISQLTKRTVDDIYASEHEPRERLRRVLQVLWYINDGVWTEISDEQLDCIIKTHEVFETQEKKANQLTKEELVRVRLSQWLR